ncbi:MAG: cytochrome c biogenesis protein ResB [Pyrinomonadaceae bacterium]
MSVAEETIRPKAITKSKSVSFFNSALDFLSSVRFGVVLLCILVAFSMVGMLIIQQNVQGFDSYFASLTPAEKTVYGTLGLFDIYYSWYYKFLLLVLSLNIVLASIDRFPSAWSFISKPKFDASRKWLLGQKSNAIVENSGKTAEEVFSAFKKNGLSATITEKKGKLYVFGDSGKWNRLGAYIVHVFLLTLFLGHFVALQTGFDADVRLTPDSSPAQQQLAQSPKITDQIQLIQFNLDKQERFNVQLPFTITCTEIAQELIDPKGSIEINNTLDWRTQIKIDDPEYGTTVADVSLNKPFEYRGYRFFQASAITIGSASEMTLDVIPQTADAQPLTVNIERNATSELPDGTKIKHEAFYPDFVMQGGELATRSAEYENPVAVLSVTPPNGNAERVFAFANKLPDNAPINAPKAGYRWRLHSFKKSPIAHVLSIKYDPFNAAFIAWYIGGFGLIGALCFVFFLSHRRIWAIIDKENNEIVLGGNTNRNQFGFEDKFNKIVSDLDPNYDSQKEV